MGVDLEIETDEQRLRPEASEVERLLASNNKARDLLGWSPSYGGLDGFRRGLEAERSHWFRDATNLGRYKPDEYNV